MNTKKTKTTPTDKYGRDPKPFPLFTIHVTFAGPTIAMSANDWTAFAAWCRAGGIDNPNLVEILTTSTRNRVPRW